tara:strand:- start:2129 stop:2344 length:216 start_codon:yes stop_codon:yes gene_type:complete
MNKYELTEKVDNIFTNIINNLNTEKENLLNIINSEKKITTTILDKKIINGLTLYYDKKNNINYDSNCNIIN